MNLEAISFVFIIFYSNIKVCTVHRLFNAFTWKQFSIDKKVNLILQIRLWNVFLQESRQFSFEYINFKIMVILSRVSVVYWYLSVFYATDLSRKFLDIRLFMLFIYLIIVLLQVGACIVNRDKKIVGIGYNGMPNGCNDDELPWRRTADDRLDTKYPYGKNSHDLLRRSSVNKLS